MVLDAEEPSEGPGGTGGAPRRSKFRPRMSAAARQHRDRRLAILKDHPELRELSGPNPWSLLCLAGLVALHIATAWLVRDGGVWWVFAVAFCWGQLLLHAGGALVHDAAHSLILGGSRGQLVVDLLFDTLLTSFGHHKTYQLDHTYSHHPCLGDYERDYEHRDVCRVLGRRELRRDRPAIHGSLLALHLFLDILPFGFVKSNDLIAHLEKRALPVSVRDPARNVPGPPVPRRLSLACSAVSLATLAAVGWALGPWALLYWVWSLSIFQGHWAISNMGQIISEHPDGNLGVPTRSTYGPWNWLLFNTGYHDEHHTFPGVPWNRLPELHAAAPEMFTAVGEHGYFYWWWCYVFRGAPRRPSQELMAPGDRCGGAHAEVV